MFLTQCSDGVDVIAGQLRMEECSVMRCSHAVVVRSMGTAVVTNCELSNCTGELCLFPRFIMFTKILHLHVDLLMQAAVLSCGVVAKPLHIPHASAPLMLESLQKWLGRKLCAMAATC